MRIRKLAVHASIIGVVMVSGDLTLNEGRAAQAVLRDLDPRVVLMEGRRQAYHANAFIERQVGAD